MRAQDVSWEAGGRVPVLAGGDRRELSPDEAAAAESLQTSHGLVLFRGFDIDPQRFRSWTLQLGGAACGSGRVAPGARDPAGVRIGLHLERIATPSVPASLWFYAVRPAKHGGETLLCDGAAVMSSLSAAACNYLEQHDMLYWARRSTPSAESSQGPELRDPPGLERNFRALPCPAQQPPYDVMSLSRPLVYSYHGRHRVFGNQILNSIAGNDDGGPPQVDRYQRVRTAAGKPLPRELLAELSAVADALCFRVKLQPQDALWLDNTRILHGREAYQGSRQILVRYGYHLDQVVTAAAG